MNFNPNNNILDISAFSPEESRNKKIIIWGAWQRGLLYQQALIEKGIDIEAFIDSSPKSPQFGAPQKNVLPTSILESNDNYYILVALDEHMSVLEYLDKLGYQEYVDYIYPAKTISIVGVKHGYSDCYGNFIQGDIGKATIKTRGNARLIIGNNVTLSENVTILCGWNSCVTIGSGSILRSNTYIRAGASSQIIIGEHCKFGTGLSIKLNAESSFVCGDDCLFSYDIRVRADHGHAFVDRTNQTCTRGSGKTILGSHVWVGMGVFLLAGAEIGDHCVIGAGSVVKKAFPQNNVTLAGVPAKIIKENTDWLYNDQASYEDYLNYIH